jgi:membrane protein DedA with SNARE-associated domain
VRVGSTLRTLLALAFVVHFHHHFRGPPIDYAGLGLAAGASWLGVPGPGEPVLIAAGVLAARHRLDIGTVLVVAWAGANAGAIIGWVSGLKLGRGVLTAHGPLLKMRTGLLERGDEVFGRYPVFAILLTPSVMAGIHRVRPRTYLLTNGIGAAVWSAGIGLGAYFAGPAVIEGVNDLGTVTGIGLIVLVAVAVGLEIRRRRRRRARRQTASLTAEGLSTTSGGTAPDSPRSAG